MRLLIILSTCCFCAQSIKAQIVAKPIKDSTIKRNSSVILKGKNENAAMLIANEIDTALTLMLRKHSGESNSENTWIQIRSEATSILMQYYLKGKLIGTKPGQAFFIKMGNETMTASDIANHQMILLYGIALVKPSEFAVNKIVTVTK